MSGPTRYIREHQVGRMAAGLRRAGRPSGIDLTVSFSRALAEQALALGSDLGVTNFGPGLLIHTVSEQGGGAVTILGYADNGGQWLRRDQE